jgi:hypothetical protein
MARFVTEFHKLFSAKRQRRVSPTLVIAELDFVCTWCKPFDDRAYLAALKRLAGDVFQQCNHGQQLNLMHCAIL